MADSQRFALNGVTIVNTRDGTQTRGMTIVIENGKIAKIGETGSVAVDRALDATGKFVVPGYLDMHCHPFGARDQQGSLDLMLAHGITGVRQMSGAPEMLAARRDGTLVPAGPVPELLAMPGTILTPFNAGSPEAAVAEVRRQKEAGADFIKIVEVTNPAFFAALGEANRLGLPFAGHIPASVSVVEAAKAGMRAVEHLFGSLEACCTDEAALLVPSEQKPPPALAAILGGATDRTEVLERALANPILLRPPSYEREQRVVETFNLEKCLALIARFVAAGTWQVPTLIRLRTMECGDDPLYPNDPNLRYMPRVTRQIWEGLGQQFAARIPAVTKRTLAELFSLQSTLVKMLKQAGVNMVAGSDFGGGWCVPGTSLHQEFELLSEAGLSPLEILQMTTLNGAKFLGREASMGTVEQGKNADLVLLDADPLAGVQNLKTIHAVVRAGTLCAKDMLDALKKRTEERHAA